MTVRNQLVRFPAKYTVLQIQTFRCKFYHESQQPIKWQMLFLCSLSVIPGTKIYLDINPEPLSSSRRREDKIRLGFDVLKNKHRLPKTTLTNTSTQVLANARTFTIHSSC